jgi:hypothetical protein
MANSSKAAMMKPTVGEMMRKHDVDGFATLMPSCSG